MKLKVAAVVMAATLIFPAGAAERELTPGEVFKITGQSIVVIDTFGADGAPLMQGSGVAVANDVVVSNCHVFKSAKIITLRYATKVYPAQLRDADNERDLCSVSAKGLAATPARIGSTAQVKVGDRTYAIGAPKGLELTLSDGLISSIRPITGGNLLQLTAPISHGSSGGGLFDSQARLIGITTFNFKEGQQLNFAVPVEWVSALPQRSVAGGQAAYAEAADTEQARLALNALGDELEKADPSGYERRHPRLVKEINDITSTLPPNQWADATRRAYDRIRRDEEAADAAAAAADAAATSIEAAKEQLRLYDEYMLNKDPTYAEKRPILSKQVAIIQKSSPPAEWLVATGRAYAAIPTRTDAAASGSRKVLAFERAQVACKTIVLSSSDLANQFELAGAGSLSDICSCAATLSVASLTEADAYAVTAGGDKQREFLGSLASNISRCVQIAP